jgi:hypothetical protein
VVRRIIEPKTEDVKGDGENYTMRRLYFVLFTKYYLVKKSRTLRWVEDNSILGEDY